MQSNKQKLWILLGVIAVIFIIVIVATSNSKKTLTKTTPEGNRPTTQTTNTPETPSSNVVQSDNPILKDAIVVVPGANPITKDNKVVTREGKPTQNDIVPMTPGAPNQTAPVDKNSLPSEVIKLTVTAAGWSPSSFSVKPGAPVSLAAIGGDSMTHIFAFDDPSLSAVAVGIGPGETRAITFNAPTKPGEYSFQCSVPGHAGRGEVGKMIVK